MRDTEGAEVGSIYISSEQIIQEVQKYRCLYDPADPDHKDRDVVKDAWLSVSQAVVGEPWSTLNEAERNEAAKEVQRRWKNIRDCFRKSLSARNKKPYMFHNLLTFLLEMENSKSRSDTEEAEAAADESAARPPRNPRPKRNTGDVNYADETPAAQEADEEVSEASGSQSQRPKRKRHKPRQIIQTAQKDNYSERGQSSAAYNRGTPGRNSSSGTNYPSYPSTSAPEPENPDRLFLLSLLPRVNVLSSRNKLDFQIKAMRLLQGYEKSDSKSKE